MGNIIEIIKKNKKDIIFPVTVLLAICIIIPLALSLTNKVTAGRIDELAKKNEQETMSGLIKADEFEKKTCSLKDTEFDYFIAKKDSSVVGYIFITDKNGYGGGEVSVMTAVNPGGTVKSVAILDVSSQTPGLGQNAGKEKFYSQYAEKKSGISLVKSGADSGKNEVDAVAGATITSKAVTDAVNEALEDYDAVVMSSYAKSEGTVADNEE